MKNTSKTEMFEQRNETDIKQELYKMQTAKIKIKTPTATKESNKKKATKYNQQQHADVNTKLWKRYTQCQWKKN